MDYEKSTQNYYNLLLNDTNISQANLNYLKKFLKQYDVSTARKGIFYRSIRTLFQYSKDFKKEMHSREDLNEIYSKIRARGTSPSVNQTIMSCARTLAIWLNEGTKPKGFADIKFSKKKYKRKLQAKDMISWEDILEVVKKTKSVQLQAILTTLLDGSFRPSEFTNIKYGDVDISNKPFIEIEVDGKTGERSVWLFRSVSYLAKWINAHPTKKQNDPLWIIETPFQSRRKDKSIPQKNANYEYQAIQKRIRTLFKEANITKPCDYYNFRHSGAILMALDNIPVENRARKMGHSVEMHIDTYGRWDKEKERAILRTAYNLETIEDKSKPIVCKYCQTTNEANEEYCSQCHNPLTTDIAIRDKEREEEKFKKLDERLKQLEYVTQMNKTIPAKLTK
jgi:integrase